MSFMQITMLIEIHAVDTLFFRDGRPFTMGDDSWTNSVFPPYPSVLYGALRSICFAQQKAKILEHLQTQHQLADITFKKEIEALETLTETFAIHGVYYKLGGSVFLPLPLDCVREKHRAKHEAYVLRMDDTADIVSQYPYPKILRHRTQQVVEKVEGGLMTQIAFRKYIENTLTGAFPIWRFSNIVTPEPKIGIGRDDQTHAVEETKLFRVDAIRSETKVTLQRPVSEKLSILVECDDLLEETEGILKFGGEGKAASYRVIAPAEVKRFAISQPPVSGRYFKVCLTTPALFENGWKPAWADQRDTFCEHFPLAKQEGIEIQLVAAAVGKPLSIGGFDMKLKQPKPMRKAVPAGSVYYFEVMKNQNKINITDIFQSCSSISEYDAQQGFGLFYIGGIA